MDRQQAVDAFFNGEIHLKGWDMSGGKELVIKYEPDKFLFHIDDKAQIIRIPKGGWSMMDVIVPEILRKVEGPVIEIGMGESTDILADHAYEHQRKLYSCDIQMGGMFKVFDKPLYDNHICFIGRSEDFIKQYDGEDPAVVFIDGEHKYETVKMEVDFFLPRLREGGVIFMHDTFPQEERLLEIDGDGQKPGDIYKVRQELERNPEVDVLTWPYTANNVGLTMVLKHRKDREFWLKNGRL